MQMQITKKDLFFDQNLIVKEIDKSIRNYNWDFILSELPKGSILVGGYIRDLLLGKDKEIIDIDIVVPSDSLNIGSEIAKKFNGKFVVLDRERNIVRIIFKSFILDIASQVGFSLLEDLKSRDFTINAIGFDLDSRKIIDPSDGIHDLNKSFLKSYRTNNLLSDPLRLLRCFRFYSELNFEIDQKLIDFIYRNKNLLDRIPSERIIYELKKILKGENSLKAIILINKLRIFDWLQDYERHSFWDLELLSLKYFNKNEISNFLPLFYLIEVLDELAIKKLKFSRSEIKNSLFLRYWKMKLMKKSIYQFNEVERFDLHKDLEDILPAFIIYLPIEFQKDWLNRWRNKEDKLFHPRNFVDGNTLKKFLNIHDGPLLGKLLNYLSREFAYGRLNNFDEAIYKAKLWFQQNAPKCD